MKKFLRAMAFLACLTLYSGCGGPQDITGLPTHPVSGTVTYDGEPIVDADVVLHPVVKPTEENFFLPRGKVTKDGTFQISTYSQFDGAPEGEYKVVFDWTGSHEGLDEDEIDSLEQLLPEEYTSPELSEFTVTITAGENQLQEFSLN